MWTFVEKYSFHSLGEFWVVHLELCGNCAFPRIFHTKKLGKILLLYLVKVLARVLLYMEEILYSWMAVCILRGVIRVLSNLMDLLRNKVRTRYFRKALNLRCLTWFWILLNVYNVEKKLRSRSRTAATSNMERFVIIVNSWKLFTIVPKRSILHVAAVLDPPLDTHKVLVRFI